MCLLDFVTFRCRRTVQWTVQSKFRKPEMVGSVFGVWFRKLNTLYKTISADFLVSQSEGLRILCTPTSLAARGSSPCLSRLTSFQLGTQRFLLLYECFLLDGRLQLRANSSDYYTHYTASSTSKESVRGTCRELGRLSRWESRIRCRSLSRRQLFVWQDDRRSCRSDYK